MIIAAVAGQKMKKKHAAAIISWNWIVDDAIGKFATEVIFSIPIEVVDAIFV